MFLVGFGLAFGFLWCTVYSWAFVDTATACDGLRGEMRFEAASYPQESSSGDSSSLNAYLLTGDGRRIKTCLVYYSEIDVLAPGDIITLNATVRSALADDTENTYLTTDGMFIRAYQSRGTELEVEVPGGLRLRYLPQRIAQAIKLKIAEIFPADVQGIITAMLTGDRSLIDEELDTALSESGVLHVVSISGMHVTFLVGFVTLLAGNKRRTALVMIPLLLIFVPVVGGNPPVVRAAIINTLALIARAIKRESDMPTSISLALMLLLIINPYACKDVGLQLSFAAVIGINLFSEPMSEWINERLPKQKLICAVLRFVGASLATTLGALALSTPLMVIYFGYISLVAPLTNLLTLWSASIIFVVGFAVCGLGFISTAAGTAAALGLALLARWFILCARLCAGLPYACVYTSNTYIKAWIVYLYATCAIIVWHRYRRIEQRIVIHLVSVTLTLCLALGLNNLDRSRIRLTASILDVQQGQCVVLSSGGKNVVIDCGGSYGSLASGEASSYIKGLGSREVELLILTHFHSDHVNGVESLLRQLDIDKLAVPLVADDSDGFTERILALAEEKGVEIIYVEDLMSYNNISGLEICIYPPIGAVNENERGLAVLCSSGEFDVLVTGDMSSFIERRLAKLHELPDVELFVTGHHGSKSSNSSELLNEISTEIAVISAGKSNSYGHPAQETINRLLAQGAEIYRTDLQGQITVKLR